MKKLKGRGPRLGVIVGRQSRRACTLLTQVIATSLVGMCPLIIPLQLHGFPLATLTSPVFCSGSWFPCGHGGALAAYAFKDWLARYSFIPGPDRHS